MYYKIISILLIISIILCFVGCNDEKTKKPNVSEETQSVNTNGLTSNQINNYNTHGDFQSSLFGMAIEGDYIFYRNYFDYHSTDGIKRTLVDAGEYSKYNVETIFVPSKYQKEMVDKIGWSSTDFYDESDITSINNLQVVDNWVYWASDCAIWRFPNIFDADISSLELIAVIGVPDRPTCTNFYVDGDWIYFACNAIKERFDYSTAVIEHSFCKVNLKTKERSVISSAPSTTEKLGYLNGSAYDKLIKLETVCDDGRIYFSDYTKENFYFYKDGKIQETKLSAYGRMLWASKNGHIITNFEGFHLFTDENLSSATNIQDFDFISDDGYYYTSNIKIANSTIPYYDGLYKNYFNGTIKKITNDKLYPASIAYCVAGICGDYLYYYTENESLCRMGVDGGDWEDVSWMIK